MTARRLCNVVYSMLAEGRDEDGLAELDATLNPPAVERGLARREQLRAAGIEVA